MIKSWNVENVETAQRDVSVMLFFPVTTPPHCTAYQCLHLPFRRLLNADCRFMEKVRLGDSRKESCHAHRSIQHLP